MKLVEMQISPKLFSVDHKHFGGNYVNNPSLMEEEDDK
jgi:hypothetical protein